MAMKVIVFPPLSAEDAGKVESLLKTMGEFMDAKFTKSEVRVLQVEFDAERTDVATVLGKIAASKKSKK